LSELSDKQWFKEGTEFCTECPGRRGDHATYCTVPQQIEDARKAAIEEENRVTEDTEEQEQEQ
jgi:hypothetical protein